MDPADAEINFEKGVEKNLPPTSIKIIIYVISEINFPTFVCHYETASIN